MEFLFLLFVYTKKNIDEKDKYALFFDFIKLTYFSLWDVFKQIEEHYIQNNYEYKLVYNKRSVFYGEFYNGLLIK